MSKARGFYYLNFTDLSEEAQEEMIEEAVEDLEKDGNKDLEKEAELMKLNYDVFIRERAESHMRTFDFVFNP